MPYAYKSVSELSIQFHCIIWFFKAILPLLNIILYVLNHCRVWLFATPWIVAHQAPLSMGILQASILKWVVMTSSMGSCQPRDQTQVSCIAEGFFIKLSHQGSTRILDWVAYPFFRGSSQPRNLTRVSCIAGRFFTIWVI